jgi:hypothetical protein
MEIQMHIPQIDVINFLQKKGYEVKAYTLVFPATEEMLLSEPRTEIHTFTATKPNENQTEENLFLNVFEKEIKDFLKEI